MPVLVLGVGYIGSALVIRLLERGEEVVVLDNLFSTDERVLARFDRLPHFRLIQGDVADERAVDEALKAAVGCQVVYNLAAQASSNPAAATAEYTETTNLRGPRVVLDAMCRHGVRTLVYGSSLRVYGDSLPSRVDESTPYGRFADLSHLFKCYVEKLAEMYSGLYGLRCLALRLGLVYGVAPVMKTDYRFMTAPNKFCLQAVRGEEVVVRGSSVLGFIHVDDAARALLAAADHAGFEGYVPINAATEVSTVASVAKLVEAAARGRGLQVRVKLVDQTAAADCTVGSKLAVTSFVPHHTLHTAVPNILDHFASGARP